MNRILRALIAPAMALSLSSCYDAGLLYPSGGFAGGNYGGNVYRETVYQPVGGYGNPGWGYGGFGGGGLWGAGGGRCCSRCGYNPCRCSSGWSHYDHDHDHDHDRDHRSSSNKKSSSEREYRIIAGDLDGKKKPNDFHSLDWYHDRGYSLEKVKMETDRGAVIDKRPSSQKSSSQKSSSQKSSSQKSSSSNRVSSSRSSSNSSSSRTTSSGSKKK